MRTPARFLFLWLAFSVLSVVISVKEWKNYENGKVHSHRKLNYKRLEKKQETFTDSDEQHFLHGHHGDKAEHHVEEVSKESSPNSRGDIGAIKKDITHNRKNGKHTEVTSQSNMKSLTPPAFEKKSTFNTNQHLSHGTLMEHQTRRKNLSSSTKVTKVKKGKKKDTEEKKRLVKNNHTLLRSATPKSHKNKSYKKDRTKSKGHVYGNSKAKSLFNNLQYDKGGKTRQEYVKNGFKLPPPPSYSTMW